MLNKVSKGLLGAAALISAVAVLWGAYKWVGGESLIAESTFDNHNNKVEDILNEQNIQTNQNTKRIARADWTDQRQIVAKLKARIRINEARVSNGLEPSLLPEEIVDINEQILAFEEAIQENQEIYQKADEKAKTRIELNE